MRNYVKRTFKQSRTASIILLLSLLFIPMDAVQGEQIEAKYHDYAALTQALKSLASINSKITKLQSIGKTLQGRNLWMLRISGKGSALEKQALLI